MLCTETTHLRTQKMHGDQTMAAKSPKYETLNVTANNAHVWHGHVVCAYKRANNVLNVKTVAGFHGLVFASSDEEANTIKKLMLNGLPE
jgi:hypothetical protein